MLTMKNPAHVCLVYSYLPANSVLAETKLPQIKNAFCVNLSQYRFRITCTLNSGAVSFLIRPIFLNGSPLKILEPIVRPISVQMPGLKTFRAFTLEGFQNQPVHQMCMLDSVKS